MATDPAPPKLGAFDVPAQPFDIAVADFCERSVSRSMSLPWSGAPLPSLGEARLRRALLQIFARVFALAPTNPSLDDSGCCRCATSAAGFSPDRVLLIATPANAVSAGVPRSTARCRSGPAVRLIQIRGQPNSVRAFPAAGVSVPALLPYCRWACWPCSCSPLWRAVYRRLLLDWGLLSAPRSDRAPPC